MASRSVPDRPPPASEQRGKLPGGCRVPPPLYPRAHISSPVLPARQAPRGSNWEDLHGSQPPILPPRDWCCLRNGSQFISTSPTGIHLSPSERKLKSGSFNFLSSASSNRTPGGDNVFEFAGGRFNSRRPDTDSEGGRGTFEVESEGSRGDPFVRSSLPDGIVPLSRWPIPIVVVPRGVPLPILFPDGGISFDRQVGSKMEAVANEYVEAPSLKSPSGRILERPEVVSPPLDVLRAITTQPTPTSIIRNGKDGRSAFASKKENLLGDGGLSLSSREIGRVSSCEKSFDFASSPECGVQPACKAGLVCSSCKKCRCEGCSGPRRLPVRWVGPPGRRFACGADEMVRVCSCLCCVQTIFYHCFFHPDDDFDPTTDPCACCEEEKCCLRWSLMIALVPILPCLCCYCPLRCALGMASRCLDSCSDRGCRCGERGARAVRERPASSTSSSGATRDLVPESESSSA